MNELKLDEKILKLYSIYWYNDENSFVAIKNEQARTILKLKKEFKTFDKIPDKYTVEIYFLHLMGDSNTLTVDLLSKETISLNKVHPKFLPISLIDLK